MATLILHRPLEPTEHQDLLDRFEGQQLNLISHVKQNTPLPETWQVMPSPLTEKDKQQLNYTLMDQVVAHGDKPVGQHRVKDWLTLGSASFWHYHKFRIYFQIRNFWYELEEFKQVAQHDTPVLVYTSHPLFRTADIARYLPDNVSIFASGSHTKTKKSVLVKYVLFLVFRYLTSFGAKAIQDKHLLLDTAIRNTLISRRNNRLVAGNAVLHYVFELLTKDFAVIRERAFPTFTESKFHITRSDFEKYRNTHTLFGERLVLGTLWSRKLRYTFKDQEQQLLQAYAALETSAETMNEVLIAHLVRSFHPSARVFLFKYLAYNRLFQRHKPKSISAIDENSPSIKCILDAARNNGVPTIGIQHGSIHALHPAYRFTPSDFLDAIPCEKTLVWGESTSQVLIRHGNFPPETIVKVGQPRTDIIDDLRKEIPAHLKPAYLDGRKMVLFATQPQRDARLRYQAAYDLFVAARDMPDIQLVLKLHPGEKNDVGYYRQIASDAHCHNYQIDAHSELYILLACSHIVITCFSTVGAEAIYFKKPLIIIDHLRQDIQSYHKAGVAYQATDLTSLTRHLQELAGEQKAIEEPAYNRFIEEYAYQIDGKVSERIIDYIRTIKPS